jgi:methionyl-tRNA synthetase
VLRYDPQQACGDWSPSQIEAGRVLVQPGPLFKKLDVKIVEEERARLGQPKA